MLSYGYAIILMQPEITWPDGYFFPISRYWELSCQPSQYAIAIHIWLYTSEFNEEIKVNLQSKKGKLIDNKKFRLLKIMWKTMSSFKYYISSSIVGWLHMPLW